MQLSANSKVLKLKMSLLAPVWFGNAQGFAPFGLEMLTVISVFGLEMLTVISVLVWKWISFIAFLLWICK